MQSGAVGDSQAALCSRNHIRHNIHRRDGTEDKCFLGNGENVDEGKFLENVSYKSYIETIAKGAKGLETVYPLNAFLK